MEGVSCRVLDNIWDIEGGNCMVITEKYFGDSFSDIWEMKASGWQMKDCGIVVDPGS